MVAELESNWHRSGFANLLGSNCVLRTQVTTVYSARKTAGCENAHLVMLCWALRIKKYALLTGVDCVEAEIFEGWMAMQMGLLWVNLIAHAIASSLPDEL
jgi:hypothetical protein